ncbi:MAG: hypothetical protein A3F76_02585 [Burkholderiales bacterium RIFCSPLOWO2_12_FULL_65_40]|nr:MAG: hypothetical protein A3F76_02585 [Burkholderiales bacterium RIFCSPLOWO2_12_FULL_65_40]
MGMAGQCGGCHGVAEEAGADRDGAWDGMGVSVWGSVARCADAGSVGRYSGPRWPQALRPATLAARMMVLTRIWDALNISKL